jgi:hypothetical protein
MREYASKPKHPSSVALPQSLPPIRPFALQPQTLGGAGTGSAKHAASHLKHASEHGDEALGLKSDDRGRPLPASVRKKMESAFGHDFSAVRIHRDRNPSAVRAPAYARGNHLYFAPGQYEPSSTEGQALLGHELTHVVQQRAGRVAMPQGKGVPINSDARHEAEAHASGLKAALGERVKLRSSSARTPSKIAGNSNLPVQRGGKFSKATLTRHARAYERTRYYHATRNTNVNSIVRNGLDPGQGGGANGAAAASGNADFIAHSQRRIHLTKSKDTGRFYRNYLGGRNHAQILRAFTRRSVRKNVEVDPDSTASMQAYRTTSAIKGKYIRPLGRVLETMKAARRRKLARYKAIRSNYHAPKPSLRKVKRIHKKALEEGYVSD